jgi:hypothetical protein
VAGNVEADQVVGQHALEDLALPRQDTEHFRVGPRDVPEQGDVQIGPALLEELGGHRQVVVLNEHQRRTVADLVEHRFGEAAIDLAIALEVAEPEARPHVDDVTQRPQRSVGEARVVELLVRRREPDALERITRAIGRTRHAIMGVHGLAVGAAAAVRHPQPAERLRDRIERDRETAGVAHGDDARGSFLVRIRLAVGDDDQLAVAEVSACPVDQLLPRRARWAVVALAGALRRACQCVLHPRDVDHAPPSISRRAAASRPGARPRRRMRWPVSRTPARDARGSTRSAPSVTDSGPMRKGP